ncbi:MAG: IS30 family transposase, partial [Pseudomonadota bacterium]
LINKCLGSKSYFCNPYHSWEKGSVENTIGLVRRFLPKKTDFASISKSEIKYIENWLNNRPRKCLNYDTPSEVFNRERCT